MDTMSQGMSSMKRSYRKDEENSFMWMDGWKLDDRKNISLDAREYKWPQDPRPDAFTTKERHSLRTLEQMHNSR